MRSGATARCVALGQSPGRPGGPGHVRRPRPARSQAPDTCLAGSLASDCEVGAEALENTDGHDRLVSDRPQQRPRLECRPHPSRSSGAGLRRPLRGLGGHAGLER
jgi:hypothetical protein